MFPVVHANRFSMVMISLGVLGIHPNVGMRPTVGMRLNVESVALVPTYRNLTSGILDAVFGTPGGGTSLCM
jgi:hypothetical protein